MATVLLIILAVPALISFGLALLEPYRFDRPFWPTFLFALVGFTGAYLAWAVGSQAVVWLTATELRRPLRRPVPLASIRAVVRTHRLYLPGMRRSGTLAGPGGSRTGFDLLPTITERSSVELLGRLAARLGVRLYSGEAERTRRELDKLRGSL